MNRLQKKCFIASTGFHLLLVIILIVGPAFLSSRTKSDNLPTLNFVAVATVDSAISGGGNPTAPPPVPAAPVTPPAQPVAPAPEPQPQPKPVEPAKEVPAPEPPKIERPSPDAFELVKPHKHTIEINDKLVTTSSSDAKATANAAAKRAAKEKADARRRAAEISRALASLKGGLAPSTSIELQGPGGGGVPYGNFLAAVKKAYTDEWIVPDGVSSDAAATVSVTIARDGTVISARIVKSSENDTIDRSVQTVLDHVKFAAPLPEDSKEDQRTVNIVFDVKSKLIG
jgi:TonB family protein